MTADAESRLRDVERELAGLQQEVANLKDDVKRTEDVGERLARIEERMKQLKSDMDQLFRKMREDAEAAAEREKAMTQKIDELGDALNASDKSVRRLVIGAAASVSTSVVLGALGLIVARVIGA